MLLIVSSEIKLQGVVLHSVPRKLESSRLFYEALLGAKFEREQHGKGPQHYSHQQGAMLIELYPNPGDAPSDLFSFALSFYTADMAGLLQRMHNHSIEPEKRKTDDSSATFHDPQDRNIRVHQQLGGQDRNLYLDEIILHSTKIEESCSFYQLLLGVPFLEQPENKNHSQYYWENNNDIALKLYPDDRPDLAPSPSLRFSYPDLDEVKLRMKGYAIKDLKDSEEILVLAPDNRKIFIYS